MWVYDGERWIEEGESEQKPEQPPRRPEEMYHPELQVVEIVPVTVPKTNYVPPFPMP